MTNDGSPIIIRSCVVFFCVQTPELEEMYSDIWHASSGWDGSDLPLDRLVTVVVLKSEAVLWRLRRAGGGQRGSCSLGTGRCHAGYSQGMGIWWWDLPT